ncbi:bile-acid 7-alpha-dehydratase [Thalassobaculum fulvum]|uniref:Bile-acid 7-alpha-dehydratase n=1 Tax=Thalassobaculum fulvum TaxID=1633335 RepID=A0A918XTS6_9PROT|nr:nuclear transport factor 2 family protein [Thalassobaculum fulvum]GHD52839.1 bile-acid 7-alpha-dehydratase [Thalassobaculum fulvum]
MRAHDLDSLLALEEIKRLKAAYCRYLDTKQWDRLRSLFADDTVFEGFGSAPTGSTADQFVAGVAGRLTDAVTIHHCHMPEIEFIAPHRARGVWAMMDLVELGGGRSPKEAPGHRGFHGLGHYEEEYRVVDGAWKFCFLRLTRLRVDPLPLDHPLPRTDLLAHSPDWLPG